MKNTCVNSILVFALIAPVAVFLFMLFLAHIPIPISAAIAVIAGWAANVAWARSADRLAVAGESNRKNAQIATRFGWLCPAFLVAVTWAILRLELAS